MKRGARPLTGALISVTYLTLVLLGGRLLPGEWGRIVVVSGLAGLAIGALVGSVWLLLLWRKRGSRG